MAMLPSLSMEGDLPNARQATLYRSAGCLRFNHIGGAIGTSGTTGLASFGERFSL